MSFTRKKLESSKLLGERLRELRQEAGVDLHTFAEHVCIPEKHLRALENGEYAKLPGDVYVKNFLKKIARALQVDEQRVLGWYAEERAVAGGIDARLQSPGVPPQEIKESFSLSLRFLRLALFSAALLSVALYLGWQLQQIFRAPDLIVTSPENNLTLKERSVVVEGMSEPEAEVRVNNREIPVDREGGFRERVNLRTGVNTIRITAKRGRSTTAVEQRLVFVEEAP